MARVRLGPFGNLGRVRGNHFVVGCFQVGAGIVGRGSGRDARLSVEFPLLLDPGSERGNERRHHVEQVLRAFEAVLGLPAARQIRHSVPLDFLQSQHPPKQGG